jgi:predicted transcriptional regulator
MAENAELISLTADIVSSMVANNKVATNEISDLINSVHAALARASAPAKPDEVEKPTGVISVRKSLADPSKIISMIDGKPYSAIKRHITRHGFTPESYREAFGLPASYPMVAQAYSAVRREISLKLGLSRKKVGDAVATVERVAEAAVETGTKPVKSARKKLGIVAATAATAAHSGRGDKAPKRRGRPPKAKTG